MNKNQKKEKVTINSAYYELYNGKKELEFKECSLCGQKKELSGFNDENSPEICISCNEQKESRRIFKKIQKYIKTRMHFGIPLKKDVLSHNIIYFEKNRANTDFIEKLVDFYFAILLNNNLISYEQKSDSYFLKKPVHLISFIETVDKKLQDNNFTWEDMDQIMLQDSGPENNSTPERNSLEQNKEYSESESIITPTKHVKVKESESDYNKERNLNQEKNGPSHKSCDLCKKELPVSMFLKSIREADGYKKTCRECSKKQKAVLAIKKLLKYVEPDTPFTKKELYNKVDGSSEIFENYIFVLQEQDIIRYDNKSGKYILEKNDEFYEYYPSQEGGVSSYGISGGEHFKPSGEVEDVPSSNYPVNDVVSSPSGEVEGVITSSSSVNVRLCDTCKKELPLSLFLKSRQEADGYRKTCKNCSKKINAARGLEKILKWVSPGEEFKIDELKSRIDEPVALFENYIWVLQELDLIKYNEKKKTFQLEVNNKLEQFSAEFNIALDKKDNKKSGIKTCEICKKELPVNKFMRSSLQADGYHKICRGCSKNKKAASGLKELLKYVELNQEFDMDHLKKNVKGPVNLFENYIWVLQELDLITYNEKKKTFKIETNEKLNHFSQDLGLKLDEIQSVKSGAYDKEHEEFTLKTRQTVQSLRNLDCTNEDDKLRIRSDILNCGLGSVDYLIELLTDSNPCVRENSAWLLGELRDKKAIRPLLELKDDDSVEVIKNSAYALDKLGDKVNSKKFLKILEKKNYRSLHNKPPENISRKQNGKSEVKVCDSCQQALEKNSFYKNRSEKDGLSRKCKQCIKKDNAFNGIKEILKFTALDKKFKKEGFIKKQKTQNKTIGTIRGYLKVPAELGLLDQLDENTYILKETAELKKFLTEYNATELLPSKPTPPLTIQKKCEKCHQTLPTTQYHKSKSTNDGYSLKCKECIKKDNAFNGIKELLKIARINIPYNKERILNRLETKTSISKSTIQSYIRSTEDLGLITKIGDNIYIIKETAELKKFLTEYNATHLLPSKPKPPKTISKKCEKCQKTLPNTQYYKNSSEPDRLSRKCKDCIKKDFAFIGIKEILKFAGLDKPFKKEGFIKKQKTQNKTRSTILGYLNDPVDLGLLDQIDENTYILKETAELKKFLTEYNATHHLPSKPKPPKTISKKCEKCQKTLPNTQYYKNKLEPSGLSKKCKLCLKKDNAYNGIKEILKFTGLNKKFKKEGFIKKQKTQNKTRSTILGYLKEPVELGLLDQIDENTYILKETAELKKFLTEYNATHHLPSQKSPHLTKQKKCETCHQTLPNTEFHQSKITKDGLSLKCIECIEKERADIALNEITQVMGFHPFMKESLVKKFKDNNKPGLLAFKYLKLAEDFGFLEKTDDGLYILKKEHMPESIENPDKKNQLSKTSPSSIKNLDEKNQLSKTSPPSDSGKVDDVPEDIIIKIFIKWLFKYNNFNFLPHSEEGLLLFKGILKNLNETEIEEFIQLDVLDTELILLEKRSVDKELNDEDIEKIHYFLKDIFTYLNSRFGDKYWTIKPVEKPALKGEMAKLDLWDHQKEAIRNWIENGSRGLLEMATGTGKTLTAIGCLKEKLEEEKKLLVIIACPFNHLISQWDRELDKQGLISNKIIANSTNMYWRRELKEGLMDINLGISNHLIVLTTHKTLSSKSYPGFMDIIEDSSADYKSILIVDEVHGIGAPELRKGLLEIFDYRLGLSATPSRWFDESGTTAISNYFNGTVFKFDLKKAINSINPDTGKSFLCPYEYRPYFVDLNYEEISNYNEISFKIAEAYDEGRNISTLIKSRHEIVDNAHNKYGVLRNILDSMGSINFSLIYCSPRQIESVQDILNERAIIQHKFTMKEGVKKEKKLNGLSQRDFLLRKFSEGVYQVLVAIRCLDEGVDVPSAEKAILMSSTRNPIQHIQRRGRILRRSPGKEKAVIYDLIVIPKPTLEGTEYKKMELEQIKKEVKRYKEFAETAINHEECLEIIDEIKIKLGI